MKPDNLIVGVDFSELDNKLCNYVNFLADYLPVEHVNNLFIFTARESYRRLKSQSKEKANEFLKTLGERMHEKFDNCYPNFKRVKNHALAGLFVETFYHQFNKTDTDFIVIGKKKDSHGINAKNIIRHIPAHTLVVPESAEQNLTNIVISIDISEYSKRILKHALEFCSLLKTKPEITVLHIGHLPYYSELDKGVAEIYKKAGANNAEKAFFEEQKKDFENFVSENSAGFESLNFKTEFIPEKRVKSYKALMDYINAGKADLLIMGTKSHSAFDVILMGSFAEKMITVNDKIPTLIVK